MAFTGAPILTNDMTITNDGFYPNVSVKEFIDAYRIPAQYDAPATQNGVLHSVINVNSQLVALKAACVALSYSTLLAYASAHSELINGSEVLISLYKKAVFCYAKAFLSQQFDTMNPIKADRTESPDSINPHEIWLREADNALAAMLQRVSVSVGNGGLSGFYAGLL